MTLRYVLKYIVGIDEDPLGCAFIIATFLRSSVQGKVSTFEGDCSSLVIASEYYDIQTGDGIRMWLNDLGKVPDIDVSSEYWLSILQD